MSVYSRSTLSSSVTWPEPIESVWHLLPASGECPPGYKRQDLLGGSTLHQRGGQPARGATPLGLHHLAGRCVCHDPTNGLRHR